MSNEKNIKELQERALEMVKSSFPFEYQGYDVDVTNIEFIEPKDNSMDAQQQHFMDETTMTQKMRGDILIKQGDKVVLSDKNITIANLPYPTDRGSYILGGNEKVFINQMLMRQGVFIHPKRELKDGAFVRAEVRAGKKRFTITYNTDKQMVYIEDLGMEFGYSGGKIDAIAFLLFMGTTPAAIKDAIGNEEVANHLITQAEKVTPEKLNKAFFEEDMPETEDALRDKINAYLNEVLKIDEKGQRVQKEFLNGFSAPAFTPQAFLETIKGLFDENESPGTKPDIDDLRFKEILNAEAIMARSVETGLFEWSKKIKERIRRGNIRSSNIRPTGYLEKALGAVYNSNLTEAINTGNPLDLEQKKNKITIGGMGGLSDRAVTNANRNLRESEFGKIDPIETPQSSKLGVTQHLAQGAEIRNGTIYSKFYRVKNGVIDTTEIVDDVDAYDEYEEYVAFNNPKIMTEENGERRFKEKVVRVRHKGKFEDVPVEKVTLVDYKSDAHLGKAAALVPFSAHNDGSRMLMGASMQRQALVLENAEAPLVQSVADEKTGKTMEQELADKNSKLLRSPITGKVTRIANDYIEITGTDGKKEKVNKLNYYSPGKSGSYINHKPVVAVGDEVKAGELLADGWQTKGGTLALGKNTTVAYMPFKGYNFEDGVAVSESWANSMASEEVKTIEYTIEYDEQSFPPNETKAMLKKLLVSDGILNKLDERGIIKKGEKISAGDIFVGQVAKKDKSEMSVAERIVSRGILDTPEDKMSNRSKYAKGYQRGTILDVKTSTNGDFMKVSIKMLAVKPLGEGDKIAGRHGNKGTISAVIPDNEMPHTEDGKPVDLVFSPLAVPSRKNLGQLLEVNAGLVAQKKGLKSYNVQNFDGKAKDKLFKELEEIGMKDGKQTLINPESGKPYESRVTVGPMYIMKLHHEAEGKIAATSFGAEDAVTALPKKLSGAINGDRTSPQNIGGMEFWSLTSAGATENILEMTTLKSDGSGSAEDKGARLKIFNAIKHGTPMPEPATPQTLIALQDQLYGAGVQMVPLKGDKETTLRGKFDQLMLQPMHPEFAKKLANGEVQNSKTFNARTAKEDPKGLYSKEVFGEKGDKWGRISVDTPIPNPIFLKSDSASKPYAALLQSRGFSQRDIVDIVENGKYVVLDPKDSGFQKHQILTADEVEEAIDFDDKDMEVAAGSSAIAKLLKEVNIEEELKFAESKLAEANSGKDTQTKIKERSQQQKHIQTLARALDKGFKAEDFLMPYVPVLPVKYRQPVKGGSNDALVEDGITLMYQKLMKQNEEIKRTTDVYGGNKDLMDREVIAKAEADRYETVANIIGTKPFIDNKRGGVEYEGILKKLGSKQGFIRDKMQGKTQNYSGRSVIVVGPELDMDEVGLPEAMAAELFKPQIQKELLKRRFSPQEIRQISEDRDEEFRKALAKVAEKEVVILNRAPSLHRHSVQAFHPKIRWDIDGKENKAIALNAIVTTGFNADFDGDTMAVHVPIGEKAKKEAFEKLLPSKNLLNPTSNSIITDLKHEMQLGIYYATRDRMPQGMPQEFKSMEELKEKYAVGEIKTYDAARVPVQGKGTITSTVGKHLFNSALPPKYMDYEKHIDMKKGKIEALVREIMEDNQYGPMKAAEVINKLKNIGFQTSTNASISIGVRDFDPIASINKDKLFKDAEKSLLSGADASRFIDNKEELEISKAGFVQEQIKQMIDEGVLGEGNDVDFIRQSGARGGAGQISAMGGLIGQLKDVTSSSIRPVRSSLIEGTRPDEFWDLSNDSRKGIYDRSVATQGPGELSRKVWMANKQTMITERDCGDTKGIELNLANPSDKKGLYGRILLEPVKLKGGSEIKVRKYEPLTRKEVEKIRKDAVSTRIRVRSPLSCKSSDGICQACYGLKPGTMSNELVPIGEAVGSIASQAIGEPAQQSIMKTFHTGGASNNLSSAFAQTKQVLELGTIANKAVLAEVDGTVTDITNEIGVGAIVKIDGKKHVLGKFPQHPTLKVGVKVTKGDPLTILKDSAGNDVTVMDPRDVLRFQGVQAAQSYLTDQLEQTFRNGGIDHIDRRHSEIVVGNMTNRAVVESGGSTGLRQTQEYDRKKLESFNTSSKRVISASLNYAERNSVIGATAAEDYTDGAILGSKLIVKKGEKITEPMWEELRKARKHINIYKEQATFTTELRGIGSDGAMSDGAWLDNAAVGESRKFITKGTGEFAVDKLNNPLTRQMTGKKGNFGDNFAKWSAGVKEKFGDMLV